METTKFATFSQTNQMIVTTMCLLIVSIDAGPVSRLMRRRPGTPPWSPDYIDLLRTIHSPDSDPTVALPLRSTEPFDLVPRVDGLRFVVDDDDVDDTPRVLRRFQGTVARSLAWYSVNGPKKTASPPPPPPPVLAVRAGSTRSGRSQRVIAAVSFVAAGVTVSAAAVCLLVRLRRRQRGGGNVNDVIGDVTKREPDDVIEAAAAS